MLVGLLHSWNVYCFLILYRFSRLWAVLSLETYREQEVAVAILSMVNMLIAVVGCLVKHRQYYLFCMWHTGYLRRQCISSWAATDLFNCYVLLFAYSPDLRFYIFYACFLNLLCLSGIWSCMHVGNWYICMVIRNHGRQQGYAPVCLGIPMIWDQILICIYIYTYHVYSAHEGTKSTSSSREKLAQ